jgi:hypothetical protein
MITEAVGLFLVAILLALVEIEIEGKFGWSEKIPTWYRTTGIPGRLWGLVMGGKPLTGYHLFFNGLLLAMLHLKFFEGIAEWTVGAEMTVFARYIAMGVVWDFLWFALNPHYTIKNYRRKNVWWFAKSPWVFGLFPIDYAIGLVMSVGWAFLGGMPWNDVDKSVVAAENQLILIGFMLLFTFVSILLSPLYRLWYRVMRKKDDRDKAGIFHTLP